MPFAAARGLGKAAALQIPRFAKHSHKAPTARKASNGKKTRLNAPESMAEPQQNQWLTHKFELKAAKRVYRKAPRGPLWDPPGRNAQAWKPVNYYQ